MERLLSKQFILFALVGLVNTGVTFIVYTLLVFLHTPYLLANVIGYITGMLNSFLLNKRFVFQQNEKHSRFFIKFAIVNICTLGVQSVLLLVFVSQLGIDKIIAQLYVTAITLILNYIGNKYWSFQ